VADENVVITNGESTVELPPRLAALLLGDKDRDWKRGRAKRAQVRPPAVEEDVEEGVAECNTQEEDDDPIPMTHIPGVVPGISMNRLKKLVADGTIPHMLDNRTKLIRPSDVRAAIAGA
jgi:hypothetical protein